MIDTAALAEALKILAQAGVRAAVAAKGFEQAATKLTESMPEELPEPVRMIRFRRKDD